jgi:hypothetical protein
MAWLQVSSAKELRGDDPEVLRVLGMIEGAMGRASALEHYDKLSQKTDLTPDDLQARAEITARYGDDAKFTEAVDALEKSGRVNEAGALRTARQLRQGDIDRAITEARAAAAISEDPALRLDLARLLLRRYRPEFGPAKNPSAAAVAGSAEVVEIIDGLLDTPQRKDALAFAINEVNTTTPANRQRWAAAAMEKIEPDNPALLAAAAVMVRSGQKTPQEIHEQLRPVYDAAPLERRAAYALWLTGAGLPKEALTMITAQEAGESTAAFGARTEALFAMENLDAVLGRGRRQCRYRRPLGGQGPGRIRARARSAGRGRCFARGDGCRGQEQAPRIHHADRRYAGRIQCGRRETGRALRRSGGGRLRFPHCPRPLQPPRARIPAFHLA